MDEKTLLRLAKTHGTPLVVVDHKALRENYGQFRKHLPRVQVYYAVKANSAPEIVKTFYEAGASFDVASMAEFLTVHENVKDLPDEQRQAFIWDRIIYANPIKATETLEQLDQYKPLVTYDNHEEVIKIAKHAPHAGLVLRLARAEHGVDGGALEQVRGAAGRGGGPHRVRAQQQARGRRVELPRRQPVHERPELHPVAAPGLQRRSPRRETRGYELKLLDIGGGFPAHYDDTVPAFRSFAQAINPELDRLFPQPIEILAEPGRFLVASAATAVVQIIGKAVRGGQALLLRERRRLSHVQRRDFRSLPVPAEELHERGPTQICSVFGPTCDALDTISLAEQLPDLELGELIYAPNIGAYSAASSTSHFNGFPPAKVVHVNQ